MDQEKIGQIIKKIRLDEKMNQAQFAQKYNVTFQAVSKWENGKNIPDISILKQICEDYGYDLNDLLNSKNTTKKNKNFFLIITTVLILTSIIIFVIIHSLDHPKNFEFKTLSATCDDFTLFGSIAFNNRTSSIYISNIDYCGGDDENLYKKITCTLYEEDENRRQKISNFDYNKEDELIDLETFLKITEFKIDDYEQACKDYKNSELYLEINAYSEKDKKTTYKIPLELGNSCSSTSS